MMSRLFCSFCISLACIASLPAQEFFRIDSNKAVGHTPDDQVIFGSAYGFDEPIRDMLVDTASGCMLVVLQNGYLTMLDIDSAKVLWSKKIDNSDSEIYLYPQGVFRVSDRKACSLYDLRSGETRWANRIFPCGIYPHHNIVLNYKESKGISGNKLEARSFTTGELLWRRELSRRYGWNDQFVFDDSTLFVLSDGLHKINLYDGGGYSYKAKTGVEDYSADIAIGVAGLALGVLTGYFVIPDGEPDRLLDLVSNVLIDGNRIYLANRENVVCLDEQLNIVWRYDLPRKQAAFSSLFIKGGRLYMLNHAYGYRDNLCNYPLEYAEKYLRKNIGCPFVACWDKVSGENIYFKQLKGNKENVKDVSWDKSGNTLSVLFEDALVVKKMDENSDVEIVPWQVKKYGRLGGFYEGDIYYRNGSDKTLFSTIAKENSGRLVYNTEGTVYEISGDRKVLWSMPRNKIYRLCFEADYFDIISRDKEVFAIDKHGQQIARLNMEDHFFCVDDVIYALDRERKCIFRLDVQTINNELIRRISLTNTLKDEVEDKECAQNEQSDGKLFKVAFE